MTATILWGVVADSLGHTRWTSVEGETTERGTLRARRIDTWAEDPADDYASTHDAPLEARWCHGDRIGHVVALRRQHGNLLAVAEVDVTPDELQELTDEYGDLRWSSSTQKRGRHGKWQLKEISLTPKPASIGLPAVRWHRAGTSHGNLPMWVAEDCKRAKAVSFRSRGMIEVYDAELPTNHDYGGDRYAFQPGELMYSGAAGSVISINGRRPVGRAW